MNDYELYLVKRAHYKKQLMRKMAGNGVTVLGMPVMYDPYAIYKKRKQEVIDAIAAPKFTHDNAKREAAAAVAAAKRRNLIYGAAGGTLTGALGGAVYDNYNTPGAPMHVGYGTLGGTLGGLGLGLTTAAISNATGKFDSAKSKGWDKGSEMDREVFRKAQEKYDADVAKAVKDFNMKYTGMEDPDHDAIYKGGIKLHDER